MHAKATTTITTNVNVNPTHKMTIMLLCPCVWRADVGQMVFVGISEAVAVVLVEQEVFDGL